MKINFLTKYNWTIKEFIRENIWDNAFKRNWNYKTHIRENIKTWNKEKNNLWRDFIRDSRNFFKPEDYINYYLAIKQLIDFFPKLVDAYIKQKEEDIKNWKPISINEVVKYFEFIATFIGIEIKTNCKENKRRKQQVKIPYQSLLEEFTEV